MERERLETLTDLLSSSFFSLQVEVMILVEERS